MNLSFFVNEDRRDEKALDWAIVVQSRLFLEGMGQVPSRSPSTCFHRHWVPSHGPM